MNKKQFELFQTVMQWVLDEQRRRNRNERVTEIQHRQDLYASAVLPRTKETNDIDWDQAVEAVVPGSANLYKARFISVTCPSAACVAGHAVLLNGDTLVADESDIREAHGGDGVIVDTCMDSDGNMHMIYRRAMEVLGLDEEDKYLLGAYDEDLVIGLAANIAAKHGYELELV